jgi:hypothetical protein
VLADESQGLVGGRSARDTQEVEADGGDAGEGDDPGVGVTCRVADMEQERDEEWTMALTRQARGMYRGCVRGEWVCRVRWVQG